MILSALRQMVLITVFTLTAQLARVVRSKKTDRGGK